MKHSTQFLALANEAKAQVKEINVSVVQEYLTQAKDFFLIDVREDNEWEKGHLPKAIHLGRGIIERDIVQVVPDSKSHIVLYCGGGYRSALAAVNLKKMGYSNVESMDGGFTKWVELGLSIA